MSNDHRDRNRLLGPGIPFVDVEVRTTNPRSVDLNQHVVDADSGTGTSSNQSPGFDSFFTKAFIVAIPIVPIFIQVLELSFRFFFAPTEFLGTKNQVAIRTSTQRWRKGRQGAKNHKVPPTYY